MRLWKKVVLWLLGVLILCALGLLAWVFYIWRFEIMQEYIWRDAGPWPERINVPVDTKFPFDCAGGKLGTSTHELALLNLPLRGDHQLELAIFDETRQNRLIFRGQLTDRIILKDIEFCEKQAGQSVIRSYFDYFDAEVNFWGGRFHFVVYDPKDDLVTRIFSEAGGPFYSGSHLTVELYPFVREDQLGRYAVRVDKPTTTFPGWYNTPRLYLDPL